MFFSHTTLSSALYYRCHQELPPHPDAGQGPDASSIVFDRPTAAPTYQCSSPTPVGRYLSLTHRRPSRVSSRAAARAGRHLSCPHPTPPKPGADAGHLLSLTHQTKQSRRASPTSHRRDSPPRTIFASDWLCSVFAPSIHPIHFACGGLCRYLMHFLVFFDRLMPRMREQGRK
jgi:hypothetical protein